MPLISSNAVVEPGAKLAGDVRVGPFACIGPHVSIAPGCVIDSGATVTGRTELGAKNHVFPMAVVGCSPSGQSEPGRCVVGQANAFREHTTVFAGREEPTQIGNANLIMIASHVGAGAVLGDHDILANCTQIGAGAKIENYVGTSAFAVVEPGAVVGEYTFVAGYTTIRGFAPPYAIVQGCPYRVRGVNGEKLRRCGFGEEDIRLIKNAFREVFDDSACARSSERLDALSADLRSNPYVARLIEFVRGRLLPAGECDG